MGNFTKPLRKGHLVNSYKITNTSCLKLDLIQAASIFSGVQSTLQVSIGPDGTLTKHNMS